MDIINVDELGNIIEDIDWSVWRRERIEEVIDTDGKLAEIRSYCSRIPQIEIDVVTLADLEQKLAETDYISSKFGDALMGCTDATAILTAVVDFNTNYKDIIAQRQTWRDQINEIRERLGVEDRG